jgi:hypothetical protein
MERDGYLFERSIRELELSLESGTRCVQWQGWQCRRAHALIPCSINCAGVAADTVGPDVRTLIWSHMTLRDRVHSFVREVCTQDKTGRQ